MHKRKLKTVSFTPTPDQLLEIEQWLLKEYNQKHEGFYIHWKNIQESFNNSLLGIVCIDQQTIGFVTWSINEFSAKIILMEIKPGKRKKGFGHLLTEKLLDHLRLQQITIVHLECSPESSQPAWRKLGFIDFPPSALLLRENKRMYQPIIPAAKMETTIKNKEYIELWDNEPIYTKHSAANWLWPITYKNNTPELELPILYPGHADWRIRWRKENQTLFDDKVKRFNKGIIWNGECIQIKEMPLVQFEQRILKNKIS